MTLLRSIAWRTASLNDIFSGADSCPRARAAATKIQVSFFMALMSKMHLYGQSDNWSPFSFHCISPNEPERTPSPATIKGGGAFEWIANWKSN